MPPTRASPRARTRARRAARQAETEGVRPAPRRRRRREARRSTRRAVRMESPEARWAAPMHPSAPAEEVAEPGDPLPREGPTMQEGQPAERPPAQAAWRSGEAARLGK